MTGRRAIIGLCMLCALVFSAFAAQGAAAASNGTTAFTCKKVTPAVGTAGFSKEHCRPEDAVSSNANYEHVSFAPETTTKLTGNNKTTEGATSVAKLHSIQAGINEELQATTVSGEGWMTNAIDPTGEHYAHGEGVITYSGVTVTKPLKKCKVYEHLGGEKMGAEGVVKTNQLKATTTGQGDRVKFEPAAGAGAAFAIFWVTECEIAALNGTYEVKGSLTAPTNGATIEATGADVTSQGTLTVRGQKAGLEGTLTLIAKDETAGDPAYTPLSVTTVETP